MPKPRRFPPILIVAMAHYAIWLGLGAAGSRPSPESGTADQAISIMVWVPAQRQAYTPSLPATKAPQRKRPVAPATSIQVDGEDALAPARESAAQVPAVEPAPAGRLDVEHMRMLARAANQGGQRLQLAAPGTATQAALEKARRPQCDDEYTPQVGSIKLTGLMKLPFLLKGGSSEQGCKW